MESVNHWRNGQNLFKSFIMHWNEVEKCSPIDMCHRNLWAELLRYSLFWANNRVCVCRCSDEQCVRFNSLMCFWWKKKGNWMSKESLQASAVLYPIQTLLWLFDCDALHIPTFKKLDKETEQNTNRDAKCGYKIKGTILSSVPFPEMYQSQSFSVIVQL